MNIRKGREPMDISYGDLVRLNAELRRAGTRYHLVLKDAATGCIEPPGECCLTPDMEERACELISRFFAGRGSEVRFSENRLYFWLEKGPETPSEGENAEQKV